MANELNLRSWKQGQSGNPSGKPKGTKHLSTWIQDALEDESFTAELLNGDRYVGAPVKAIVATLIHKSLTGDLRAIEILAKYGYGTKLDVTSDDKPVFPILAGASKYLID